MCEPSRPPGKLTQGYLNALYRYHVRLDVLRLLREKYQLSIAECQGQSPEVVRERQKQYDEHLRRLREAWKKEDEDAKAD